MNRQHRIGHKIEHIEEQIAGLENGLAVAIVGGRALPLSAELAFQRRRLAFMRQLQTLPGDATQNTIIRLSAALSPEELACKYGDVRHLSQQAVEAIAFIELAEIALGTHPGIRGK